MHFEFSDGQTVASKTFAFQRDATLVQYSDSVTSNDAGIPHLVQWRGGSAIWRCRVLPASRPPSVTTRQTETDCATAPKAPKNGPANSDGSFSVAGIDDQYFAAAFLPPANTQLQTTTFDDWSSPGSIVRKMRILELPSAVRREISLASISAPRGSALHLVNPKLDGIIDWGYFSASSPSRFSSSCIS